MSDFVAGQALTIQVILYSRLVAPITSAATVELRVDNGSFGSATNSPTHIDNGAWELTLTAEELTGVTRYMTKWSHADLAADIFEWGTATLSGLVTSTHAATITAMQGTDPVTMTDLANYEEAIGALIGTPIAIDGGSADVAGMLTKMIDDNDGGSFDATNDSLNAMRTAADAVEVKVDTIGTNLESKATATQVAAVTTAVNAAITAQTAVFAGGVVASGEDDDPASLDRTIIQYDDYLSANSRAKTWTNAAGDWFGGDITDATITFTACETDGTEILETAGAVVTPTGTQAVKVELTSAQTALFTKAGKQYKYQLLLEKTDYRTLLISGGITVTLSLNPEESE
jgi:hypothetical protein